jgi:hypothetical protein
MKMLRYTLVLAIALFAFTVSSNAQVNPSSTYVSGYTKADGTYVQGYYKTTPNSTNRDNYTTKPNVNPYTNQPGTVAPDNKPAPTYNYNTPSTTTPSTTPAPVIQTGPRGGQYYINSNGNKAYIKQ